MNKRQMHALSQKAQKAMKDAIKEVVSTYKAHNLSLAVWKDGKVVDLPPDKVRIK